LWFKPENDLITGRTYQNPSAKKRRLNYVNG